MRRGISKGSFQSSERSTPALVEKTEKGPYEIGNASEIGERRGETTYEPVGDTKDLEVKERVSIFRKYGN